MNIYPKYKLNPKLKWDKKLNVKAANYGHSYRPTLLCSTSYHPKVLTKFNLSSNHALCSGMLTSVYLPFNFLIRSTSSCL